MRIGILTFHRAYNCGAMLQAWALKKTLERMGHDVSFPSCNHVGETKRFTWLPWCNRQKRGMAFVIAVVKRALYNAYSILIKLFSIPCEDISRHRYNSFRRKYLPEVETSPALFKDHYDLLISGSDQVFSDIHSIEDAPLFFCENKPSDLRAITYAASYGDSRLEGERLERVVAALDNFDRVSVRERQAEEQLSALSSHAITEVLDPTLLMSQEDYDEIAYGQVPSVPYLFVYTVYMDPFIIETSRAIAKRLGIKCIIAPSTLYSRWLAPRGMTYSISPDRLVQYARHATYVLAGSFHGTVMGVVFKKPFLSLRAKVDVFESRPASLLRKIGCSDRLVNPSVSLDEMVHRLTAPLPDYSAALEQAREASLAWLKEAVRE